MLSEFQIILGINTEDTQKKLDKALKRNVEQQSQKPIPKTEPGPGPGTAENLVEATTE